MKASVCIPVYNGKASIERCIASVQRQTVEDIEILVHDNCSSDGTWELVEALAAEDPRIKPMRNDENIGMVGNFNRVVSRATGDYVAFLGADDQWAPCFLASCIENIEHYGADSAAQNWAYYTMEEMPIIGDTGERVEVMNILSRECKTKTDHYLDYRRELLLRAPASLNGMLFKKETIECLRQDGKLFTVPYSTFDFDLWCRMGEHGLTMYYDEAKMVYIGASGNSANMGLIEEQEAKTILLHKGGLRSSAPITYYATVLRRLYVASKRSVLDRKMQAETFSALLRLFV